MPDMIEPNIHPVLVHFTYALLMASAVSLFVVSLKPAGGWRETLRHAGDWMLAFGAIAAVATVAAGFQAFYSVVHDGPSHAAMTTHRNFAVPTAIALVILALWRFTKRSAKPGPAFSTLFLIAAGFLTVTAWWGGKLVYAHGLGVKSMPKAEGPGHDHHHGPAEGHGPEAEGAASSDDQGDGHDHGAKPGVAASATATPAIDASAAYPDTPVGVVEAFAAALKSGDAAMVERLLAPDVLIAEGGGAERSFADYANHHLPADMAFTKAVEFTLKDRKVFEGHDLTTIVSSSEVNGEFKDQKIHSASMETMVLKRVDDRWRIAHIHWSSAEIKGEHKH